MGVFDRFRRKAAEPAEEVVESAAAVEPEVTDEAPKAETETPAPEGVEIPKQQCAEEAADSEAGEGART
ncbi:gliding motility protein [Streptomyces sp. NBC_00536]|uniref:gliding motility protein n=1 Tax=Streptomyces sp. NBC_00536 TaxID=2975769 RepID=UPI002E82477C|nr:gliding motility protein [Streptomyces sp. NBC_00536]WUC81669.1 gliding motility protein [Streptomyces sp. NBC_00536]